MMQDGLRRTPVGGALRPLGADDDLVSVVVNSGAGSKVDFYQERNIRYDVELDDEGSGAGELELTLRNHAPTSGQPPYVIGPFPPDDEEEDVGPILRSIEAGESVALVNVYCGTDCIPGEARMHGAPVKVATDVDLGIRYIQHYYSIRSGEQETLVLSWDDPRAWEGNSSGGIYRMTFTNQVTIRPATLHLRIEPPPGMQRRFGKSSPADRRRRRRLRGRAGSASGRRDRVRTAATRETVAQRDTLPHDARVRDLTRLGGHALRLDACSLRTTLGCQQQADPHHEERRHNKHPHGDVGSGEGSSPGPCAWRNHDLSTWRNPDVSTWRNPDVSTWRNPDVSTWRNHDVSTWRNHDVSTDIGLWEGGLGEGRCSQEQGETQNSEHRDPELLHTPSSLDIAMNSTPRVPPSQRKTNLEAPLGVRLARSPEPSRSFVTGRRSTRCAAPSRAVRSLERCPGSGPPDRRWGAP